MSDLWSGMRTHDCQKMVNLQRNEHLKQSFNEVPDEGHGRATGSTGYAAGRALRTRTSGCGGSGHSRPDPRTTRISLKQPPNS